MRSPVIIAHRGASVHAPENTMPSFIKAIEVGAGGLELDVQLSRDGHLVVIHDEYVDRTSNGKGLVRDKTLEELRSLDFGSWFSKDFKDVSIPLLEEVLQLFSSWDGMLDIEIKNGPVFYPGIEAKVVEAVNSFDMKGRTIISSFNHYSLVEVRRLDPGFRTAPLYMEGIFEPWEYAAHLGAFAIHPLFYNIIPEIMAGCRQHGIAVNPFTVDRPEHIRLVASAGVDGIITNVPDTALKIVKEMGG